MVAYRKLTNLDVCGIGLSLLLKTWNNGTTNELHACFTTYIQGYNTTRYMAHNTYIHTYIHGTTCSNVANSAATLLCALPPALLTNFILLCGLTM